MVSGRQRCGPESKRECEGVDPYRAHRTQPTPRLYCSEGSPSALPVLMVTGRGVRPAFRRRQDGKATGVATRSAGAGRLFLYESSALSCCRKPWEGEENPTVLLKTTTCEPGDLPSTGMVPTLGRFPRCQHGGCRGDVLHPRVHVDPTVPIRLYGSCIQLLFARV